MRHDVARGPAQYALANARVAIAAHHQQIRMRFARFLQQRLARLSADTSK